MSFGLVQHSVKIILQLEKRERGCLSENCTNKANEERKCMKVRV